MGKAQKYVPFQDYKELSIANIKSACMKHFDMPNWMCCDILAGEKGPSCVSVKQIPERGKVIHVRFIDSDMAKVIDIDETSPKRRKKNAVSSPEKRQQTAAVPSRFVPRSLSVVDMLKLGKTIHNTTTSVKLQTFDMSSMVWSSEVRNVEFVIDTKSFASGGIREAFKANNQ